MANRKKKGGGTIFSIIVIGLAIGAIWKNEHRFDYYKAAKATAPVQSVDSLASGALFSHSGTMDRSLTLEGKYVQSFTGYLRVNRSAEIYAWDRDEDDDGVSWSKQWMSSLEGNERNNGLTQKFSSTTIAPSIYQISDLNVQAGDIQFVDSSTKIPARELVLTGEGSGAGLVPRDDYFYLSKGKPDKLGDERISYSGIPVPEVATYFGKWGDGSGIAHQAELKEGFIADIIQDKGILHHLVAGSRETALTTIKEHLARLKMIVRIIGLVACTIGGGIFFSSITRLLVFIPVVGPFLNQITGWIGMLFGFLLGLLTLVFAILTSQPLILVGLAIIFISAIAFIAKNASSKRKRIRTAVAETLGHTPSPDELKELEFIELWQLAASNGGISNDEQRCLDQWTKRNRWSQEKITELTHRAGHESTSTNHEQKLATLIRYSLADGQIDRKELKTLQSAASWVGLGKKDLRNLMNRIQTA